MASLRTRMFQSWFRISRPLTLGVRAVVENGEGQVFMVRHTYVEGWYMPGGGVEKAETCLEALERELLEEGGFRLSAPPDLIGIYSNHRVFPNDHVLLYRVAHGTWEQGEATARNEIAETAWVDPMAPPEGTTAGTRGRFQELYGDAARDAYWVPART
ncbi:MAG: NUDIX domain-containing protein [Hyphomonas sp.]|nr:NUDIX domain-containing protein [Hyphomonas sp.]